MGEGVRPSTEEEARRGGAEDAARPGAGEGAGRDGAEHAIRTSTEEDRETGRDASERPACQTVVVPVVEMLPEEEPEVVVLGQSEGPEQEEEVWRVQYEVGSQIQAVLDRAFQLHKTTDYEISKANTLESDLGAQDRAREEELARAIDERDALKAAAEQKAQEVELLTAALQQKDEALEARAAEWCYTELQRKETAITTLTDALEEKDTLLEVDAARAELNEERSRTEELRNEVADETAQMEALQVAYTSAQRDYVDLEGAVLAACREVEGEGGPSGSSVTSRLRSLGGRVVERLKGALRLGVQKALGVVSTHYLVDLEQLAMGYVVRDGDDDAKIDAMDQADAGAEGAASTLTRLFEGDLFPGAEDDEDEHNEEGGRFVDSLGHGPK
ncbi:uncharacterized protein LOC120701156 [Panicum virgatum]|uniref:uncharacterized protein LOC120701156 n=1 Tax=Panicum virgatum TaxID=38727 RepID=UPI0019D538B8|nr:uncharacterized protein LOC120701156 [Panicum virgatum]